MDFAILGFFFKALRDSGLGHKIVDVVTVFTLVWTMIFIFMYIFRRPLFKFGSAVYNAFIAIPNLQKSLSEMQVTMVKIEKANVDFGSSLKEHIIQTDLRFDGVESRTSENILALRKEIVTIKEHINLQ